MVVEDKGQSYNTYLSGYFQFLTATIKNEFKKQYNFNLPENILRIHLGAKNNKSETFFHADMEDSRAWTILGFLTDLQDKMNSSLNYLNTKEFGTQVNI